MLKVATGAKYLRTDARKRAAETGWHVYLDGECTRFSPGTLDSVRAMYADCTLVGIQGNTASFSSARN